MTLDVSSRHRARLYDVFCTSSFFVNQFKLTLRCIPHWWISIPWYEYTKESQLQGFEYTKEFQLPSSEYTGKLIMKTNKSFNFWKKLKFFLSVYDGTPGQEEGLWWKNQSKKSWDTVPLRDFLLYFFFIKNDFSCSCYTCLRRFWFKNIYGVTHIDNRWRGEVVQWGGGEKVK